MLSVLIKKLGRNLPSLTVMFVGALIGVLSFITLRFLLVHPPEIHFHSNYAVYVDGVREEFKSFTFYEEVAACTSAYKNNPKGRVHMHDNVNDVIHVHDKRVMYADFFQNIDWKLGKTFVQTDAGIIQNTEEKKWVFILNGKQVDRVDNLLIGNLDKLLVSYGASDTDFMAQYKTVSDSAEEKNKYQDPSSCSGLNGPAEESFSERLKRAVWIAE